jgi:hypothetical protein
MPYASSSMKYKMMEEIALCLDEAGIELRMYHDTEAKLPGSLRSVLPLDLSSCLSLTLQGAAVRQWSAGPFPLSGSSSHLSCYHLAIRLKRPFSTNSEYIRHPVPRTPH